MALTNEPPDLLPGTLDMLVLRALVRGPMHGYAIAERLRQVSEDRYYTITAAGKKRLNEERAEFDRLVVAIHEVLETA